MLEFYQGLLIWEAQLSEWAWKHGGKSVKHLCHQEEVHYINLHQSDSKDSGRVIALLEFKVVTCLQSFVKGLALHVPPQDRILHQPNFLLYPDLKIFPPPHRHCMDLSLSNQTRSTLAVSWSALPHLSPRRDKFRAAHCTLDESVIRAPSDIKGALGRKHIADSQLLTEFHLSDSTV